MGFKFMVHIGDFKQGTTSCYETSFSDIAEMFAHPTNAINYDTEDCFFVPGDNEFQDCQDRAQAWRWWMKCKFEVKCEKAVTAKYMIRLPFATCISSKTLEMEKPQTQEALGRYPILALS